MTLHWKNQKISIEVDDRTTTEDLEKESVRFSKIPAERIRLYYEINGNKLVLRPQQKIKEIQSSQFVIFDSGPQISTRGSNLMEYVPSALIWLVIYLIVGKKNDFTNFATIMWVSHFTRRTIEVLFVHIFSHATLPIFSLLDNSCFKNVTYYWTFAIFQCLFLIYKNDIPYPSLQKYGIIVFYISEALNCYCHVKLRLLRPKGSKEHVLPTGFLFDHIVSPNYTFEILSWIGFAMYAQTIVSIVFPIAGGSQMLLWAYEKKKKLVEKYPEAAKRGAILPFF